MTADPINTQTDSNTDTSPAKANDAKVTTFIALVCSIVGLVLFWYPILGIAHALAGAILGVMLYKKRKSRIRLYIICISAIAIIAAIIMTNIEIHSIEVVKTYNAW